MKILLISPGIGDIIKEYNLNDGRMEPLALGVIASLTPPEHEVSLVDDRVEEINFEERADLVAITVHTYTAKRAYYIADHFDVRYYNTNYFADHVLETKITGLALVINGFEFW